MQFELMHLRLYRTTLAAAPRLLNEFGVPRLGKMTNRSLRSRTGGNSANSQIKISDEEEFPPLSVNKDLGKCRTKLDSVTCSKQKPEVAQNVGPLQREASNLGACSRQKLVVKNIGPLQREASKLTTCSKQNLEEVCNIGLLQCEASTSISDHYDTDLPTSFGKKPFSSSRNPKLCQTYQEHGEAKRRPMPTSITPVDEPFDICPPKMGSYVNKRNRRMWSPKIQSAKENEENNVIFEEGNNAEDLVEESGLVLRSGMVLFKHYIPLLEQVEIVKKCRELGCGPGGFYRPGYNDGAKLRLYMMCLGRDWNPQTARYGERRHHDNAAPPHLPDEFTSLVCRALDDSHNLIRRDLKVENAGEVLPKMSPDVCIVNFYSTNGRLGLHQDRDESKKSLREGLPVVSISIGDTAEFLYGDERDVNKAESVFLESGDVLIFGGESRHIFHGVNAITPGSAPTALLQSTGLRPGRLNLTFRKH